MKSTNKKLLLLFIATVSTNGIFASEAPKEESGKLDRAKAAFKSAKGAVANRPKTAGAVVAAPVVATVVYKTGFAGKCLEAGKTLFTRENAKIASKYVANSRLGKRVAAHPTAGKIVAGTVAIGAVGTVAHKTGLTSKAWGALKATPGVAQDAWGKATLENAQYWTREAFGAFGLCDNAFAQKEAAKEEEADKRREESEFQSGDKIFDKATPPAGQPVNADEVTPKEEAGEAKGETTPAPESETAPVTPEEEAGEAAEDKDATPVETAGEAKEEAAGWNIAGTAKALAGYVTAPVKAGIDRAGKAFSNPEANLKAAVQDGSLLKDETIVAALAELGDINGLYAACTDTDGSNGRTIFKMSALNSPSLYGAIKTLFNVSNEALVKQAANYIVAKYLLNSIDDVTNFKTSKTSDKSYLEMSIHTLVLS